MKAKHILLPMAVILCMSHPPGRAEPAELSVTLKGGPNIATQAENLRINRYGVSGGFQGELQWPLAERFSLAGQLELLYTPRGAEVEVDGMSFGKIRDHYIDLMITARPEIYFGHASVYLLLGGGINYLLSASKDDAAGSGQDITDDLHRFDVSVLGAVGVALHLPRKEGPFHLGTVFLEVRHDVGLLDVDLTGGFKNRTSSLMLGISFKVGGSSTPAVASTGQTAN